MIRRDTTDNNTDSFSSNDLESLRLAKALASREAKMGSRISTDPDWLTSSNRDFYEFRSAIFCELPERCPLAVAVLLIELLIDVVILRRPITADNIVKIGQALGVKPEKLFAGIS